MKTVFKSMPIVMLYLLSTVAFAQDVEEEEVLDTSWTGSGELGFVSTSGNSETTTFNLALEFVKTTERWRYRLAGSALGSSEDGTKDAERYQAEVQADRKLDEKSYIFSIYRYDADKFGAYDPQQSLTAGYGRELMKSEKHVLKGEIGAGYRRLDERVTDMHSSNVIARFVLDDVWQISGNTSWANRILVETGKDNTFTQFNTGLTVAMNDKFALKFAFEVRNNSDIPPGDSEHTDTTTTANIVYNF